MSSVVIGSLLTELKSIADVAQVQHAVFRDYWQGQSIHDSLTSIAKHYEHEDRSLYRQIMATRDKLFTSNMAGILFINPCALGEAIFALQYILDMENEKLRKPWSFIHPSIQRSSKKLFLDGHYSDSAERAFVELNDRAKEIYKIKNPGAPVPDGVDLMHKLFATPNSPLCPVCDTTTESGRNFQEGFHFMAAGAMEALRNPRAHSNLETITAEEAMRRLMFASLLMNKLDGK